MARKRPRPAVPPPVHRRWAGRIRRGARLRAGVRVLLAQRRAALGRPLHRARLGLPEDALVQYLRRDRTAERRGNVFAAICGNGWYNEYFKTSWDYDAAPWRDNPKFILELVVDGKTVLCSDERWKCLPESFVVYNQLRSGEHFDARLYDPRWKSIDFDDGAWGYAVPVPASRSGRSGRSRRSP